MKIKFLLAIGSRVNAQHTTCQLCLTKAFRVASLCPFPQHCRRRRSLGAFGASCTQDLWMRGKLRWKCF